MKSLKDNYSNLILKALTNGADTSPIEDFGEIFIDSNLADSVFKEVPLIKIGKSILEIGQDFHDAFYVKKFYAFFMATSLAASAEQKQIFIDKLTSDVKLRDRLYEKIMISIDSIERVEKAKLLGLFFLSVVLGKLSIPKYLRYAWSVESMRYEDVMYFLIRNKQSPPSSDEQDFLKEYFSAGNDEYNNLELNRVGFKTEKIIEKKNSYKLRAEYKKEYDLTQMGREFFQLYWGTQLPK